MTPTRIAPSPRAASLPIATPPTASTPPIPPTPPAPPAPLRTSGRRLRVLHDALTVLVSGAETEGRFSLFLLECPAGSATPPHLHEHEAETFRILEGTFRFDIDGRTVVAGPGTTLHAAPGTRHGFTVDGSGPGRMLVVASPGGLERLFTALDRMAAEHALTPASLLEVCREHGVRLLDAPMS